MLFVFVCKLAGKAEVECGERVFLIFFFSLRLFVMSSKFITEF